MEALQIAAGDEPDQVVIAGHVLGKQNQMIPPARQLACSVRMIVTDIDLAPENGFDAHRGALLGKIGGPEHIAVIRDGAGGHTEILGPRAQVLEANGAVKQAVFRMAMQMHKIRHLFPRKK